MSIKLSKKQNDEALRKQKEENAIELDKHENEKQSDLNYETIKGMVGIVDQVIEKKMTKEEGKQKIEARRELVSDNNKEIANSLMSNFFGIADQVIEGTMTREEAKQKIEARRELMSDNNKEIANRLMSIFYKEKKQYTEQEYDNFISLFRAWSNRILTDTKKELIKKLMKKVDTLSSNAILFFINIDDTELNILKQQFRFIIQDKNTGSILYYDGIDEYFNSHNLKARGYGDKLKFFNDIWEQSLILRVKSSILKDNTLTTIVSHAHHLITAYHNLEKEQELGLSILAQLTELGFEIYNILKDEIETIPVEYLKNVVAYLQKQHPNLNIKHQILI